MEKVKHDATEYLTAILKPLVPDGFELLSEEHNKDLFHGLAFTIVLADTVNDYFYLVGYNGKTIATIRSLMRIWRSRYAKSVNIHVYVANPRYIEEEK